MRVSINGCVGCTVLSAHNLADKFEAQEFRQILNDLEGIPLVDLTNEQLLYKLKCLSKMGKFTEISKTLNVVIELIETMPPITRIEYHYYYLMTFYRLGKYEKGLEFLELTKALHDQINPTDLTRNEMTRYASFYNHAGILNYASNNFDAALENYHILQVLGNKHKLTVLLLASTINIAIIYDHKGRYAETITYYQKALEWAQVLDKPESLISIYNNLTYVYSTFGELSLAEDMAEKAYRIAINMQNNDHLAKILKNRGDIFRKRGLFSEAIEDFVKSYELKKMVGNHYESILTLFSLVDIYVYLEQREIASKYLELMQQHGEYLAQPSIMFQLARSLYFKDSALTRHKFQAEQILRDILQNRRNELSTYYLLLVLLWLFELLVTQVDEQREVTQLANGERKEIEDELLQLYEEIIEIQEKVESPVFLLYVYYIRAYLHLFFLQPNLVERELLKAQEILLLTGIKTLDIARNQSNMMQHVGVISPSLDQSLNKIIHVEPRLKIIIALIEYPHLLFTELQEKTGLTPGNLGRQADKLVEAGYVFKRKEIVDDKFLTKYTITAEGLTAFQQYRTILAPHLIQ